MARRANILNPWEQRPSARASVVRSVVQLREIHRNPLQEGIFYMAKEENPNGATRKHPKLLSGAISR